MSATRESISSLLEEAYKARVSDLSISIDLSQQALHQSRELKDKELEGESLNKLSLFYMITGQNEISIETAREAIKIFEELQDDKGIADAKYSIAGTYYKTDQFHLGMVELEECLSIYKRHGDYFNQARVQKSMGTIHEYFGDSKSAKQAYESCIEAGKKIQNLNIISNAYNPLSGIILKEGKIEEAMEMIEESIRMKNETHDVRGLAFALYGRGKIYARTKKFVEAEKDFLESLDIHEKAGEKLGTVMGYRKLAQLYFDKGDFDNAKYAAEKSLQYARENNIALIISDIYFLLYQIAKAESDNKTALHYLEDHIELKEKILSERSLKMIQSYEVTNRIKTLEIEAESQKEKADIIEKKNQELDHFFHRVSHDLKGPITSLMSINSIAKSETNDDKILNFLGMSQTQISRINMILDELIKLTRVTSTPENFEIINFDELIDQCLLSLSSMKNFENVKIERKVSANLSYKAPWALINSILQNLIENGIKYSKAEGDSSFLKIEVSKNNKNLIVSVQDNGIGMSEEVQKNVFDMFYRASGDLEGSGLGLYIMNRAVEKLGGSILLESAENVGSTFTVKLPL